MRLRPAPLIALLALGACREAPPQPTVATVATDDVHGGSRLSAIWLEGPDGGRMPYGFQDTLLDEECWFAVAGDGEWRCLPWAPPFDDPSYFSDATCTEPLYSDYGSTCAPPPLLQRTDVGTCPQRKRLFAPGSELFAPTTLYVRDWAGTCRIAAFPAARIFGIGAEVDYTQFVSAVPTRSEERGGLAEEYLAAEDGARKFTAFWDVAGGRTCLPKLADDGTWRCLPSPALLTIESMRADSGCVDRAGTTFRNPLACTSDRALLAGPPDTACVSRRRVFEVAEEIASGWYAGASGCSASTPEVGERIFRLGAEVPPAGFVAATVLPATGQRIQNVELELPGLWRYRDPTLRDPNLGGVEVYVRHASDGVERWMPYAMISAAMAGHEYADSACTEPLASYGGWCPPLYIEDVVSDSCTGGSTRRIFAIGEPYLGTVWVKSGSGCVEWHFSGMSYYRFGAEVAPANLAPVVRTFD
jgi:hypothetical protein